MGQAVRGCLGAGKAILVGGIVPGGVMLVACAHLSACGHMELELVKLYQKTRVLVCGGLLTEGVFWRHPVGIPSQRLSIQ